jgi:hypothetical protein
MRLHARSPRLRHQVLEVRVVTDDAPGPVLRLSSGLNLTIEAALENYDVIEASAEERRVLAHCGRPFGGVQ